MRITACGFLYDKNRTTFLMRLDLKNPTEETVRKAVSRRTKVTSCLVAVLHGSPKNVLKKMKTADSVLPWKKCSTFQYRVTVIDPGDAIDRIPTTEHINRTGFGSVARSFFNGHMPNAAFSVKRMRTINEDCEVHAALGRTWGGTEIILSTVRIDRVALVE